jgi:adenine-specific DNA-methyltransferase
MARRQRGASRHRPVEYVAHREDKRVNVPTAELADFAVQEEQAPYILRYPRDPSLDPQLVWKGKDEQDGQELEIPAVPVYIQEHIHTSAIIEDLHRGRAKGKVRQASLFDDFDGMPFEERVDFYHHAQGWSNRIILGDSLLVMASLAEKEGLKGQVQMIYMDPPYGIKFGSNWQISTRKPTVRDGEREDATREPEQIKAFRDTWKLGIHSYLAYWRDRLAVARDLLTETGSVFVQIGDENVHLVRSLLDEVFGSGNFCAILTIQKTSAPTDKYIPTVADFLLWYGKNSQVTKYRQLYLEKRTAGQGASGYTWLEMEDGRVRPLSSAERQNPSAVPVGAKIFGLSDPTSSHAYSLGKEPIQFRGRTYGPRGRYWSTSPKGMERLKLADRLMVSSNLLMYKRYLDDFPVFPMANIWTDTSSSYSQRIFVVQTLVKIVERCMLMTTDPGDLVLDPTCGSGTTAYVAEQWGRRWITIDTSRVAVALARTRLMSARFPYYILADTPEGVRKQAEVAGQAPPSPLPPTQQDIKKGFVYRRVPHITLKSIANNPDIKEGMMRAEIDAAITRNAESETLYDQPYEDNKVVRVTGPFTVESLSPHRVLGAEQAVPKTQEAAGSRGGPGQFETMVLENLKKAGVQQYEKQERVRFERLEPYAGLYIHGEGEYEDNGQAKRVAVCIGPEHGTVGTELVKDAAKEAVRGIGFDLLIICGFAFDPHVNEEAKRYGRLKVLTAKINPDLQMGDEFLKRTGAGNMFMVFGEPDIEVRKRKDSKLTVEIKGLDVYDPTTGQVRGHSTDDIACWFIDTDYNDEAFFVRHAYFCGDGEPYDKLKRALRAEIDEAAWSSLYSTVSRPFDPPDTGKIAVKVINHYGDEILKVYEV